MTLGERLKNYRLKKGLSQEKVAELVDVSRQAVAKWEGDKSLPSTANLIKLASVYDVPLSELTESKAVDENGGNKILQANLTLIAIILQTSFLNVVMQPPFADGNPKFRAIELVIKFVPLLASSVWMASNHRYEKDLVQRGKNTKIELFYCLVQAVIALAGYYSGHRFVGTALLISVALGYIFFVNPKYMNRRLTK